MDHPEYIDTYSNLERLETTQSQLIAFAEETNTKIDTGDLQERIALKKRAPAANGFKPASPDDEPDLAPVPTLIYRCCRGVVPNLGQGSHASLRRGA